MILFWCKKRKKRSSPLSGLQTLFFLQETSSSSDSSSGLLTLFLLRENSLLLDPLSGLLLRGAAQREGEGRKGIRAIFVPISGLEVRTKSLKWLKASYHTEVYLINLVWYLSY